MILARPETANLDRVLAEAHALLNWWLDESLWNTALFCLAVGLIFMGVLGGFMGKSTQDVRRIAREEINKR